MEEGAFALIDCLGWKGIWRQMGNEDPSPLIRKVARIDELLHDQIEKNNGIFQDFDKLGIKATIQLLSDTTAISLKAVDGFPAALKSPEDKSGFLILTMCGLVSGILRLFLEEEPPLVLRGCISFGPHTSDRQFLVGPAVDRAAEHEPLSEGAFVWLLPDAAKHLTRSLPRLIDFAIGEMEARKEDRDAARNLISATVMDFNYPMPIKGGGVLKCCVINPFIEANTLDDHKKMIDSYTRALEREDRIDIWIKKQHTMEMLLKASKRAIKVIKLSTSST